MAFVPRASRAFVTTLRHRSPAPLSAAPSVAPPPLGSTAAHSIRIAFCTRASAIEDRVIKAVKRYVGVRMEELKSETSDSTGGDRDKVVEALSREVTAATKWDDLGFDDLDKVEVLLEVEDEFNHVIPDDDSDRIGSVKESVEYLEKHLAS
mmetsp:Transcript_80335/g.186537  ORF Transcript_80335/g.186537 Transcript_80335/m.186537 type:complete len:151 (-) Transcript_80335:137-589(-)